LARTVRVREDPHTADLGNGFPEQLQPFAEGLGAHTVSHPRHISPRAREARDEPAPNRIGNGEHDDRDRRGGVLGRHDREGRRCGDDIDLQPDQLGREVGQAVRPALRESRLDDDVLALDPPELTQPFPKRRAGTAVTGGRAGREKADPVDLPRRLRADGARCREDAHGARDKGPPVHH
jgi:hypothetical protein